MDSGEVRELGRHVVADPAICHGQITFRGTRVLVGDVLDDVARGQSWVAIMANWPGLSAEAIAEAIQLARQKLLAQEPAPTAA